MPNAGDLTHAELGAPHFMLIGGAGAGKTTMIHTLPGRTFVFMFDPKGLRSLRGNPNIEYEAFLPDRLEMGIKPLAKQSRQDKGKADEPKQYEDFRAFFEEKDDENYFSQFDNLVLDSCSTLTDAILDRTLFLNGRLGRHPEQDDYPAAMAAFSNVIRNITALRKVVIFTAHMEHLKDDSKSKIIEQPLLIGKLRVRIPNLFSDILFFESDQSDGKRMHLMHTVGERHRNYIKCSEPHLPAVVDVTMTDVPIPERAQFANGLGVLYNLEAKEWQTDEQLTA